MPQTSRAIQPTSQDRSETLLIPTEARPTSRKSSAAWTIHLEGEPQSNDLPGVLQEREEGLGVEESVAHRPAERPTSTLCSSLRGLRFCDPFHGEALQQTNLGEQAGGQMGSPISLLTQEGVLPGPLAKTGHPQRHPPAGCHRRGSLPPPQGFWAQDGTENPCSHRPERTQLCPLSLSPDLWAFWT